MTTKQNTKANVSTKSNTRYHHHVHAQKAQIAGLAMEKREEGGYSKAQRVALLANVTQLNRNVGALLHKLYEVRQQITDPNVQAQMDEIGADLFPEIGGAFNDNLTLIASDRNITTDKLNPFSVGTGGDAATTKLIQKIGGDNPIGAPDANSPHAPTDEDLRDDNGISALMQLLGGIDTDAGDSENDE